MAKTKLEQVRAQNAKLMETLDNRIGCITELEESVAHLQGELDECKGMNDRLNKILGKNQDNIATLKNVARFYRAQRDRVDAYLSATLDSINRDMGKYRDQGAVLATEYIDKAETIPIAVPTGPEYRRPNINEPFVHSSMGTSDRDFSPYRDNEPDRNWENY